MKKLAILGLASALWLSLPAAQAGERFTIVYSTGYGGYAYDYYTPPVARHYYRPHHRHHHRHHHHKRYYCGDAYPRHGYAPYYRGAPGPHLTFRYDYRKRDHHRRDYDRDHHRREDGRRHR